MAKVYQFPIGNAKVGDFAWVFRRRSQKNPANGEVTRVGLKNKHGHKLDIEVTFGNGRRLVCGSRDHQGHAYPEPRVILFPDEAEIPAEMQELLADYPESVRERIKIVRDGGNCASNRYALLCMWCYGRFYLHETTTEASDFRWYEDFGGGFSSGKPEIVEGDSALCCGCPDLPSIDPPEYESYT